MSNALVKQILFPPGRTVQGSLYKAQDKDANGAPRIYPPGHKNAGQPKITYFFAVAIPKNAGEMAWWDTAWGKEALAIGQQSWPRGEWQHEAFAWKIEDGDSQRPNKRGRKNCSTEGMPGHWIINFSSSFVPKICDERGQPLLEVNLVKLGYWVEVYGTVKSNETASNPGIYVNHDHVAFRGIGKEIFAGADPVSIGFGKSALPPGVGAPVGSAIMPSAGIPGGVPSMPSAGVPGGVPSMPTAIVPHPGFIAPPGGVPSIPNVAAVPGIPGVPAAPVSFVCPLGAPPGFKMANLNGGRFEAFVAPGKGWTPELLVHHGHMVKL